MKLSRLFVRLLINSTKSLTGFFLRSINTIIMKRQDKTTLKQIADYWIEHNDICEMELNFDWADAHTHCWNCGDDKNRSKSTKASLQRCHIIPHSLGGVDTPSNYVLLCASCHKESPNVKNTSAMWDYIKSNRTKHGFTGTYRIEKGLELFKQKEGYCFFDKALNISNIMEVIADAMKNATAHGAVMNASTYHYMLKGILSNRQ